MCGTHGCIRRVPRLAGFQFEFTQKDDNVAFVKLFSFLKNIHIVARIYRSFA